VAHPKERIAQFSGHLTAELLLPDSSQALASEDEEPVQAHFSPVQAQRVLPAVGIDTQVALDLQRTRYLQQPTSANYLIEHGIEGQDIIAIYGHRSAIGLGYPWRHLVQAACYSGSSHPASFRLINYLSIVKPRGGSNQKGLPHCQRTEKFFLTTLSFGCSFSFPNIACYYSTNNPEAWIWITWLMYVYAWPDRMPD